MAVHAHPDDESSKGAGTYSAYASRGVEVMVVSCTGGEAGDILNGGLESIEHAKRDLSGLRRVEMAHAQEILGVQHRWLGYLDSGMAREDGSLAPGTFAAIPLEITARPLIRLVREFRPHVMITYDEQGGYPHPDHIRCHEVSLRAWRESGTESSPELGDPWRISKLYYDRTMNPERFESVFESLKRTSPGSHLVERMEEMLGWMRKRPVVTATTTQVDVSDFFDRRDSALRAHASQVAPDGFFLGLPEGLERGAYPFEDYELVDSRVDAPTPETDLFAGIDEAGA
ncbi:mycothiol conjugate amidase Mca [Pseudoclavibacter endophyticus]|uniref:Mycothiol S-conjugate amidase n=1 Tax=Pseudoclavibacter endophyticus TaxID=1778590 RepID=A0A6H9WPK1_9MICO|nr:mycothiol conjugate amidase Mca [Pseudoclavibacter endophyticus]KAB1649681.1 mycothiol conjugate amidase Mca [Pseudoclavibacter endophyticus]